MKLHFSSLWIRLKFHLKRRISNCRKGEWEWGSTISSIISTVSFSNGLASQKFVIENITIHEENRWTPFLILISFIFDSSAKLIAISISNRTFSLFLSTDRRSITYIQVSFEDRPTEILNVHQYSKNVSSLLIQFNLIVELIKILKSFFLNVQSESNFFPFVQKEEKKKNESIFHQRIFLLNCHRWRFIRQI